MGCGKSVFSKELSKLFSQEAVDLDDLIEHKEKKSITDIFLTKGEDYFRKVESVELSILLKKEKKYIVATGGGTPCFFENIDLMNEFGITIYLKRDPKLLYNQLINSNQNRPVFNRFKTKDDFFNNFNYREKFYLKSKVVIECDTLSNKEIIKEINNKLNENRFKK